MKWWRKVSWKRKQKKPQNGDWQLPVVINDRWGPPGRVSLWLSREQERGWSGTFQQGTNTILVNLTSLIEWMKINRTLISTTSDYMQIKSNDDNLLVGPRVSRRQSSYGAPAAPTSYDAPILPLSSSSSSYSSPSSSSASTSYSPSSTSGSSSGSSFRPSTGGSLASSAAAQPIYGPVGDGKFCRYGKSRSIGGM